MGVVVFLPPLLTESFLPVHVLGDNFSSMSVDNNDTLLGQTRVTTVLSAFGGGGIFGNMIFAVALTYGPLARRHYAVFVANNAVMLVVSGKRTLIKVKMMDGKKYGRANTGNKYLHQC